MILDVRHIPLATRPRVAESGAPRWESSQQRVSTRRTNSTGRRQRPCSNVLTEAEPPALRRWSVPAGRDQRPRDLRAPAVGSVRTGQGTLRPRGDDKAWESAPDRGSDSSMCRVSCAAHAPESVERPGEMSPPMRTRSMGCRADRLQTSAPNFNPRRSRSSPAPIMSDNALPVDDTRPQQAGCADDGRRSHVQPAVSRSSAAPIDGRTGRSPWPREGRPGPRRAPSSRSLGRGG